MKNSFIPRRRVALLFRYGLKAHAELHQIIPDCLQKLSADTDVYYIGPRTGAMNVSGVKLIQLPYTVNRASSRDKFLKTVLWYFLLPWLALWCRFMRLDLVWIDESLPLFGWIVQVFSGRPTMLTVVDFFLEVYREKYAWLRCLAVMDYSIEKRSWQKASAIITRTASMKRHLIESGIQKEKIHVIRDVFDSNIFKPSLSDDLRIRLGFGIDDFVLVHHGILHPNKGVGRVLGWMTDIMKKNRRIKFLIIGEGSELMDLKALVKKERLESQVVFTGWLPSSGIVNEYLNVGDVGLAMRIGQPTDHFHVTGTLVHCLMCGLPVLAARLSGMGEIVLEGEEGYLFDPSDKNEFLAKLNKLQDNKELRIQMGKNGRKKVMSEFASATVLCETENVIRRYAGG